MVELKEFDITAAGILQPKMMSRFKIGQLDGFTDELNTALIVQTISFSYDECTQKKKAILTWIIEDDIGEVASKAVEQMNKHKSLTVHNLNGNGEVVSTMTMIGVALLSVKYELDYASSNACRYVLTLSTNHKITRKFPHKAVDDQ